MKKYSEEIEKKIKKHYESLNEKNRRMYIWIEAEKLWYGWQKYIRGLVWCSINTLRTGIKEVNNIKTLEKWKIRRKWWWRKKEIEKQPKLLEKFDEIINNYTENLII